MIQLMTSSAVKIPAHKSDLVIIDCNALNDYISSRTETEIGGKASIMIRNLEDAVKQRLRVRAAEHGHSMEEEVRTILRKVMGEVLPSRNLAAAIRARVASADRADLDLPSREQMREPQRPGQ